MQETTEQQPANTKPKQSAYLVCEGALCTCDAGTAPVKLKVDSHKKAYINNNKLLATVKDVTFELPAAPFGSCKNNPSNDKACIPQFEKWTKPYTDIEVEGNAVITDKSELTCLKFKGKVTIAMHGQQQTVNETQADNMDRAIAAQVNPLADLAPLAAADKKVKVSAITGELIDAPKYKPVTTQKARKVKSAKENDADKDPSDICVRPGQEIKFTAKYEGTEALVCWKISSAKDPVYFLQHGSVYKTSFDTIGKYTIEGYDTGTDSNLDLDTQINKQNKRVVRSTHTECMLDILVQENKLTGICHLESENVIQGKINDKPGIHVRIGTPVTFEPVYLMPPNQEEVDHLILLIKDASGNELQRSKGSPNIIFAAQNSAAVYSVQAYFDNSEDKPFTCLFKTTANTISVIAASGMKNENDKIRPGTTLTFSVSKFKFESDEASEELVQAEASNIHWYDQSDIPVATGKTTFSKTYQKEGKYIVTCVVKAKSAGWFALAKNKDEADDWHFEVTRNYPTAIEQKTEGKVKVGKKVVFEMKSIFDVNFQDEGTIQWKLTGPESITLDRYSNFIFTPKQNGKYTLTVTMNGKSKELSFECITCEIVKGWWTDRDGNILTGDDAYNEPSNTIGFAGWEQEVVASFKHVGLKGEEVTLEAWDSDAISNTSIFIKDIKIDDDYNCIGCAIKLDAAIREKVTSLTSQGLLYFTVKAKNGLKLVNDGMALPQSNDQYLRIDSRERAKVYFSDNNDTRRYTTAALGTPVYIQIKSTNLIGQDLELEIWKSIEWASDKPLGSRFTFKVDKYGMSSLKLNMGLIKPEVPTAKDTARIYVKIYNKKTGKELISGEKSYKLTMYKTLATSASSIGTTKAFVVVDVSKGEKREEESEPSEGCGLIYRNEIQCTKYGTQYGPVYWGTIKIENYAKWSALISEGKLTEEEKSILVAMSENEGNLDAVQSYDSEIVTVGAMQKTMNAQGYGEFPIQMWEFKQEYPDRFKILFLNCGWDVKKEEEEKGKVVKYRAYYQNNTGSELKGTIRQGFEESNFKNKVQCIPIEPLINAAKDIFFQSKQIEDFIDRLKNKVLVTIPDGYKYKLSDYLKSKLGKATALDHHINRPAHLSSYFGASLGRFFELNPAVSKNPNEWGINHNKYEKIIIEDYGMTRSGTDMVNRYKKMKDKL